MKYFFLLKPLDSIYALAGQLSNNKSKIFRTKCKLNGGVIREETKRAFCRGKSKIIRPSCANLIL